MTLLYDVHISIGVAFCEVSKIWSEVICADSALWTRLGMFNAVIGSKQLIFKVFMSWRHML